MLTMSYLYFSLLFAVLPPSVANELRYNRPIAPQKYDSVTLMFSGIVDFAGVCKRHSDGATGAHFIVRMLNSLFTPMDTLLDPKKNPNVFKVGISIPEAFN